MATVAEACDGVVDGMKVAVLLFPCCSGNRVVSLSRWSVGLSRRFPGIDIPGKGILVLLVAPESRIKKRGSVKVGDEVVPGCFELQEVARRFARVIRVAVGRFRAPAFCPCYRRGVIRQVSGEDDTDLSCGCEKCKRGMEDGVENGDVDCCERCVHVLSREEICSMMTVSRVLGEVGSDGVFVEYEMCGDVDSAVICNEG